MTKVAANVLIVSLWGLTGSLAWSGETTNRPLLVSIAAPAYWCPYACDTASSSWGFAVDVAHAALESQGHNVVYRNLPYDRALVEAENGRVDAVIPAFKGEAPGFTFPSHPVSLTEYCFYVPVGESFRYSDLDAVRDIRFVATSGYSYGEEMDAYIAENLNQSVSLIGGEDIPDRLRELVQLERYDALLDDRLLFESSRSSIGLVNAGCIEEHQLGYLALSPKDGERSRAIGRAFDRGFKKIRENGRICEILKKYKLGIDFVPDLNGTYCLSDGD